MFRKILGSKYSSDCEKRVFPVNNEGLFEFEGILRLFSSGVTGLYVSLGIKKKNLVFDSEVRFQCKNQKILQGFRSRSSVFIHGKRVKTVKTT